MCSNSCAGCFSTKYRRWFSDERGNLFATVELINNTNYSYSNIIGKVSSYTIKPIFDKMRKESVFFFSQKGKYNCLYHNAPVNWIRAHSFVPYFRSERDGEGITTQLKVISFDDEKFVYIASAIINSSLFFVWWITNSDCYHLNKPEIQTFKFTLGKDRDILCRLSRKLAADLLKKSKRRVYVYKTTGRVEYDEFYMKRSKDIIDEIDECLGKHYGLSEIELDFIINYDIKYRLGEQADC